MKSLHVSPQFHVIFDDDFSTVEFINNGEIPSNWKQLVKASYRELDKELDEQIMNMEPQDNTMISNDSTPSLIPIQSNSTTNMQVIEQPNLSTSTNKTPLPSIQHEGDTQLNTRVLSQTDSDGDILRQNKTTETSCNNNGHHNTTGAPQTR